MSRVLLVGIGNTLRRDDGTGHAVVSAFESHPACRTILIHQLLPELVDELVQFGRVIFVDASVDAKKLNWEKAVEVSQAGSLGHVGDARWLLGLCRKVHQSSPEGYLLSIPVSDLGFGEGFSELTTQKIALAIDLLRSKIDSDREFSA